MKMRTRLVPVVLTLAIAGCAPDDEPSEEVAAAPAEQGQMPMGGMPGMQAMGPMQSESMMQQMQSQMDAMRGADPDSMMTSMPVHRQAAANMLAQMNREMREMNMTTDAEWNETVAALRNDLVRLPEMTADEIKSFLPEHEARIDRLAEMHRGMMGNMQM